MKRHSLILLLSATTLVSACSTEQSSKETSRSETFDVSENSAEAPRNEKAIPAAADAASAADEKSPGIGIGAAANLAFEYRYAFKLPDAKIGAIQNEHADACEALGPQRCQVVDMRFNKIDEKRVEAMLAFKLDPAIARKFGRDAITSVEKAEGILADGNVTGTNVGGEIEDSQGRSAMLKSQLERLQKRVATKGLAASERSGLSERIEELQKQLAEEQNVRTGGEAKLAMTPFQFTYNGDDGVPGFGKENPFSNAFDVAANSFAVMFSFLLMAIGFAGPWVILIALIVILLRSKYGRGIKNWWSNTKAPVDVPTDI
jgi:Domain of unknown function (DUF4349)